MQGDLQALGFPTTFTVGASDVTGPTLTGFTHPANVSLTGGASPITFGISATDRSGIASAVVRFDKDLFGTGGRTAYLFGNTDSWTDGASTDTETVPVSTQAGVYTVTTLDVTDTAGNTTTYTTAQLAALGYSTTVTVGGNDTTAPQLSSLAFPATVDVRTAAKAVTFAASATDSQTGIGDVTIHFDKSFSGGTGRGTIDIAGTTADPWTDGSSSLTTTLPTTTPPGVYTITDVVVTDGAGNTRTYTTAQLQALGLNTTVTVNGDSTKPLLTGLTFPATLDVSTGARNEPFTASATDNATGIRDVVIRFDKNWDTGSGTRSVDLSGATDSWTDGSSTLVVSIPQTAKSGTYTITGVDVIDGAGNVHTYTTAQLAALGIGTSLTITGGATAPDTTAPQLTSLTFPTAVNLSTGAQAELFTAAATDNATGIRDVKIHFDKDLVTGSGPGLVDLDGTGDTWADGTSTFNLTLPRTARDGTYTITAVDVIDGAGNVRSYTTAQLAALGIGTSLTITGSSVDTTAPELSVLGFPTTIDLSAGAKSANFLAAGTDAGRGIRDVRITFDKDLLGGAGTGVIDIPGTSNDPWTDGSSAFVQVIPTTAKNGTYTVTGVDVTDAAGNVRHYTTGDLATLGLNTSLTITGAQAPGGPDTIGPQISSLQYSGVFDVSTGRARFDLYAPATDQTGIRQGVVYLDHQIQIDNGNGATGATNGFAFGADGHAASYFTTSITSPIYQIDHIDYYDSNNVLRTYTTVDLAAFGLQTGFFILNASFNVSITAVFGGTYFADTLTGTSVNNVLFGLQGNDILISGGGVDWLYGGLGSDGYYISNSATHIIELIGEGTADIVYTSVSYTLEAGQEIEFLSASSVSTTTALTLIGNEFANTLIGNAGANVLRGGLGNDRLDGGLGIDTADYSDKSLAVVVALRGSTAVSVTVGGVVEDTILNIENVTGGSGDDRLSGDGLANVLIGGAGADKLFGFVGDDVLRGGLGTDYLDGGVGFDTADFSDKTLSVVLTLKGSQTAFAVVGGASEDRILNIENITGGSGDDRLSGDGLANVLIGGAGADKLFGFGGADLLRGGPGNDYLDGGLGVDTADYSDTSATVVVTLNGASLASVVVGGVVEDKVVNIENVTGGSGVDRLTGDGFANVLDGRGGADVLTGRGGNDTYVVDVATDKVIEAADGGFDTVIATASFTLASGQSIEALSLAGSTGSTALNLTGNALANTLTGNAGANILNGGGGVDVLIGGAGNDTYVTDGGDTITEASKAGTDLVMSSVTMTLGANLENLTLTGTASIFATGNAAANLIIGNRGANHIDGGAGNDTLTGGLGSDTFLFTTALGSGNIDHITDFTLTPSASHDVIGLSGAIFAAPSQSGILLESAFKTIGSGAAVDGDDRILYNSKTGALYYDADGSGAGKAVYFAVLDNHAALTFHDILIV